MYAHVGACVCVFCVHLCVSISWPECVPVHMCLYVRVCVYACVHAWGCVHPSLRVCVCTRATIAPKKRGNVKDGGPERRGLDNNGKEMGKMGG